MQRYVLPLCSWSMYCYREILDVWMSFIVDRLSNFCFFLFDYRMRLLLLVCIPDFLLLRSIYLYLRCIATPEETGMRKVSIDTYETRTA